MFRAWDESLGTFGLEVRCSVDGVGCKDWGLGLRVQGLELRFFGSPGGLRLGDSKNKDL